MFSKIGILFGGLNSLITGHYQTTILAVLQYALSATTVPGTVQAAISTVLAGVVAAAMDKKNIWTQLLGYGSLLLVILQWVGTIIPAANLPLQSAYAGIMAVFMVLMKAEGVQLQQS